MTKFAVTSVCVGKSFPRRVWDRSGLFAYSGCGPEGLSSQPLGKGLAE